MFDFLKPEVGGLKNVLNAYFAYKAQNGIIGDVPADDMLEFAHGYYRVRLGPPLVSVSKARGVQAAAHTALQHYMASGHSPHVTLVGVLLGLLAAEGMVETNPNTLAMGKVFDSFPSISHEIRGL